MTTDSRLHPRGDTMVLGGGYCSLLCAGLMGSVSPQVPLGKSVIDATCVRYTCSYIHTTHTPAHTHADTCRHT